jgi:hypothetical protein
MTLLDKRDWEITATTVNCDAVDDEVTLIIYVDGTCKCTGRDKYAQPDKETARVIKKKSRRVKLVGCCQGDCPRLQQYREQVFRH